MCCSSTVSKVAHGAKQLLAVAAAPRRVPLTVRKERLAACLRCEHRGKVASFMGCTLCSCIIAAKIRCPDEACPVGKW
jgi:hypothetical protein